MGSVKSFLRRWPKLYHFSQRLYYTFRYFIEVRVFGTKMQEWIWKTRHVFKSNQWASECVETRNHPRRQILVETISSYAPFDTILEIGCSSGANLHLLAKEFPEAKLYGIDINAKAIKEGKECLREQGITNVELLVCKADELEPLGDKSVNLVFTDATLMYIGADKIDKVIEEMRRISSRGLIYSEWHCEDNARECFWCDGHWIYNYKTLLAKYFPADDIHISKHPEDLWDDESWEKFGSIIEVRL